MPVIAAPAQHVPAAAAAAGLGLLLPPHSRYSLPAPLRRQGTPQRLGESFLGEVLVEMDFNWDFNKMERAGAFQIEGVPHATGWKSGREQHALGITAWPE